jgi:hypothetical protein
MAPGMVLVEYTLLRERLTRRGIISGKGETPRHGLRALPRIDTAQPNANRPKRQILGVKLESNR